MKASIWFMLSLLWLDTTPVAVTASEGSSVSFELAEVSIDEIHQAVDAGALTYERLTALYMARIGAYNQDVHAVLTVNPGAVADAVRMDEELAMGKKRRSTLHGIPVFLKDLIDQQGFPTTAGSIVLQDCMPPDDSEIVKRLEAAGAIILGKVSMSEFAASYGRLGYSSLGGTVLNPYLPSRSASGSSSGSAAAVAANFGIMALGSDTAGSIRSPASSSALVGIKPTKGLVPLDGVIPYSHWTDVVGPLTRTVADAAKSLSVLTMTTLAEGDGTTAQQSSESSTNSINVDYTPALVKGAMSGITLARVVGFNGGNDEVDALFEAAVADMEELGASVVELNFADYISDPEILGGFTSGWSVLGKILDFECEEPLNEYFASAGEGCPANLAELVTKSYAYNDTLNAMNPPRLEAMAACVEASPTTQDEEYIRLTTQVVPAMEAALMDIMKNKLNADVMALIFPTMLCPAQPTWYTGDVTWQCNTEDQWLPGYPANTMGWPEISVPMGFTAAGAPVGLSLLGPKYSELTLISLAYDYEQMTMHRVPPSTGFAPMEGEVFSYSETPPGDSSATICQVLWWALLVPVVTFLL